MSFGRVLPLAPRLPRHRGERFLSKEGRSMASSDVTLHVDIEQGPLLKVLEDVVDCVGNLRDQIAALRSCVTVLLMRVQELEADRRRHPDP